MSQQDDLDRPDETSEPSQDVEMFLYACLFELGIGVLGMLVGWLIGVDVRAYLPRLDSLEVAVLAKQIAAGVVAAIPMLLMVRMVMMVDHPAISEIKNVGESSMMAGLLKLTGPELLVISRNRFKDMVRQSSVYDAKVINASLVGDESSGVLGAVPNVCIGDADIMER